MSKIIPVCQCKHCKIILDHTSVNFPAQNDGSLRHVCRICVLLQQKETAIFGKDSKQTSESVKKEIKYFMTLTNSERIERGLA